MAVPLPGLPERGRGLSRSILHTFASGLHIKSPWSSFASNFILLVAISVLDSNTLLNAFPSFIIIYKMFIRIFTQIGKPMYYMETALGQYARLSPLQVMKNY